MANGAPLYQSDVRPPVAREQGLGVIPLPGAGSGDQLGAAISKFGETLAKEAAYFQHARQGTIEAQAETNYLTEQAADRERSKQSADWVNAPAEFALRETERRERAIAAVAPARQAQFGLKLTRHTLSAQKEVDTAAFSRQVDQDNADYNARALVYLNTAAQGSPTERASTIKDHAADIDARLARGIISEQTAAAQKLAFDKALYQYDINAGMLRDPRGLQQALADLSNFPNLDPLERQKFAHQASVANDKRVVLEVGVQAPSDPAGASARVGRVTRPEDADPIFRGAIIPMESRGQPDAVSPKGALGITQIMPDTAREMARTLGLHDVGRLPDDELKVRLLADPALNYRLGNTYWQLQVERYANTPVQIAAAAAAYNAGPGRADRWTRAAAAKFGPNYTAEQFASVIDIAETRNYVIDLHKRLGAPLDRSGLSYEAQFSAASTVRAATDAQNAERVRMVRAIAENGRVVDNPAVLMKDGKTPDPVLYSQWKLDQANAAATGDATARKAHAEAEFREEMLPYVQRLQRARPADAEAFVRAEETAYQNNPLATSAQKDRVVALREAYNATRALAKEDPVALAERYDVAQFSAVDPQAKGAELERQLAERGKWSAKAAEHYKVEEKPFKPAELDGMKERWGNANNTEKFELLSAMGRAMPKGTYEAAVAQMGGDELTQFVGLAAVTRPDLAKKILHGQEWLAAKNVGDKGKEIKAALATTMGGEIYGSAAMQSIAVDAAHAVYVADRGPKGLYEAFDQSAFKKAIEEVTGPLQKRNTRQTPAPPGMTSGAFTQVMDNIRASDLANYGGAYTRGMQLLDAREIGRNAMLVPMGIGSSWYQVVLPSADGRGQPVMTRDGGPLSIEVKEIQKLQEDRRVKGGVVVAQARARSAQALQPMQPGTQQEYLTDELALLDTRATALEGSGLGGEFRRVQSERIERRRGEVQAELLKLGVAPFPAEAAPGAAEAQLRRREQALEGSGLGGAFREAELARIAKERRRLEGE
jgi:soluble lytic murein transglycosylase-like protein